MLLRPGLEPVLRPFLELACKLHARTIELFLNVSWWLVFKVITLLSGVFLFHMIDMCRYFLFQNEWHCCTQQNHEISVRLSDFINSLYSRYFNLYYHSDRLIWWSVLVNLTWSCISDQIACYLLNIDLCNGIYIAWHLIWFFSK